ncbi:conjugal transfer protein, VirB3 family (plasmid) [Pseudomonas fluorescens A506]|nr:conjugal transfer protein, VirB3 family [Pseudomonas fluorescens A506]
MSEKKVLFESYNAMSRPAMWFEIPIMPMIGLLLGGIVTFGSMTVLLNWVWGLACTFPFLAALLALRFMSSIDPRYTTRVWFAIRRLILNMKYGKHLLLTSFNPKWSQYYGRRFSQKRYVGGGDGASDEISRSSKHGHSAR